MPRDTCFYGHHTWVDENSTNVIGVGITPNYGDGNKWRVAIKPVPSSVSGMDECHYGDAEATSNPTPPSNDTNDTSFDAYLPTLTHVNPVDVCHNNSCTSIDSTVPLMLYTLTTTFTSTPNLTTPIPTPTPTLAPTCDSTSSYIQSNLQFFCHMLLLLTILLPPSPHLVISCPSYLFIGGCSYSLSPLFFGTPYNFMSYLHLHNLQYLVVLHGMGSSQEFIFVDIQGPG